MHARAHARTNTPTHTHTRAHVLCWPGRPCRGCRSPFRMPSETLPHTHVPSAFSVNQLEASGQDVEAWLLEGAPPAAAAPSPPPDPAEAVASRPSATPAIPNHARPRWVAPWGAAWTCSARPPQAWVSTTPRTWCVKRTVCGMRARSLGWCSACMGCCSRGGVHPCARHQHRPLRGCQWTWQQKGH